MDTQSQVTLKKSNLASNKLELTVIDSAKDEAESVIEVPIRNGNLQLGGKKDQYCLGNKLCFYLTL